MRPRHRAAENVHRGRVETGVIGASMRPRHRAAENKRIFEGWHRWLAWLQ